MQKGNIKYKVYTIEKGYFECSDKTQFMFLTLHRDPKIGPAYTSYYENGNMKSLEYWYNRKKHRDAGPATIKFYENGVKKYEEWLVNGKLDRKGGPAVIGYTETGTIESENWWVNDKRHRVDGPAVIIYKSDGSIKESKYILEYKEVTREIFEKNILKEKFDII